MIKPQLTTLLLHAELILAAKELNQSSQSSGRKNALQMLLEAQDENGVKVCPQPSMYSCSARSCADDHLATIWGHCRSPSCDAASTGDMVLSTQ